MSKPETFTHLDVEAALGVWECPMSGRWAPRKKIEALRVNCDDEHSHAAIRLEWNAIRHELRPLRPLNVHNKT
jgi:hypothetical protein